MGVSWGVLQEVLIFIRLLHFSSKEFEVCLEDDVCYALLFSLCVALLLLCVFVGFCS